MLRGLAQNRQFATKLRASHRSSYGVGVNYPDIGVRAVVLLGLLLNLLSGCGPSDECRVGQVQCDGHVAMVCAAQQTDNGDRYNSWYTTDCGSAACVVDAQGSFCALGSAPDPDCDANDSQICRASTITDCRAGYGIGTYDCATRASTGAVSLAPRACATDAVGSYCVEKVVRDPNCPRTPSDRGSVLVCSGNDLLECRDGFALERTSCKELTCVCDASGADCTAARCLAM